MICRADTMGVFQIESRAQMSMLPRLKPRCFYDLVIEVAIVRPGPDPGQHGPSVPAAPQRRGAGDLSRTRRFARCWKRRSACRCFRSRRCGWRWWRPASRPARPTSFAGRWAPGGGPGVIDQFRQQADRRHAAPTDLPAEFAEAVFQQIRGFGEYGFPESHAASFALLVYVSAWLKYYYPAAFTAALAQQPADGLLRPGPVGPQRPGARRRGLAGGRELQRWDCTLEGES